MACSTQVWLRLLECMDVTWSTAAGHSMLATRSRPASCLQTLERAAAPTSQPFLRYANPMQARAASTAHGATRGAACWGGRATSTRTACLPCPTWIKASIPASTRLVLTGGRER